MPLFQDKLQSVDNVCDLGTLPSRKDFEYVGSGECLYVFVCASHDTQDFHMPETSLKHLRRTNTATHAYAHINTTLYTADDR